MALSDEKEQGTLCGHFATLNQDIIKPGKSQGEKPANHRFSPFFISYMVLSEDVSSDASSAENSSSSFFRLRSST